MNGTTHHLHNRFGDLASGAIGKKLRNVEFLVFLGLAFIVGRSALVESIQQETPELPDVL